MQALNCCFQTTEYLQLVEYKIICCQRFTVLNPFSSSFFYLSSFPELLLPPSRPALWNKSIVFLAIYVQNWQIITFIIWWISGAIITEQGICNCRIVKSVSTSFKEFAHLPVSEMTSEPTPSTYVLFFNLRLWQVILD